ncbi:MAG: hypothetical protein H7039_16255 [Bryobacteraceae bacterium]|nr:hypothetical protein [Bryobacteraceae bacterium]
MPAKRQTEWELDPAAWERLLEALHSDPAQRPDAYEQLRRKLVRFFDARRVVNPEELSDEVFDVLSRKLAEGKPGERISSFAFGIARMVALQAWKEQRRIEELTEGTAVSEPADVDVDDVRECLDRCLRNLPNESRELVLEYYAEDLSAKFGSRSNLATRLGLSLNALRIRAMRIRDKLEDCVRKCADTQ